MPGSDAVAFEIPVGDVARVALVRTEVAARGARIPVDGVDVAVDVALEDTLLARLSRLRRFGLPIGHAPAAGVTSWFIDQAQPAIVGVGVKAPSLLAGGRVDRENAIERRTEIQRVVGMDGRGFEP